MAPIIRKKTTLMRRSVIFALFLSCLLALWLLSPSPSHAFPNNINISNESSPLCSSKCYQKTASLVADRPLKLTQHNVSLPDPWSDGFGQSELWNRIRRVVSQTGNLTVVVFGGSVTCGEGCPAGNESWTEGTDENFEKFDSITAAKESIACAWPARFLHWFNGHHQGRRHLRLLNGCRRSTTIQWAVTERIQRHLPKGYLRDGTKVDLIISDYSVNEVLHQDQSMDKQKKEAELLIQSVLHMPSEPALCFILGGQLIRSPAIIEETMAVAIPYQVPYISYRKALSHLQLDEATWMSDRKHMNWKGHELVLQLLIRWFQWIHCLGPDSEPRHPFPKIPHIYLPTNMTFDKELLQIFSSSDNSAKLFPPVGAHDGWKFMAEKTKYGWIAVEEGSSITFSLPSATRYITVGILRSYENIGCASMEVRRKNTVLLRDTMIGLWGVTASQYDETEFILPQEDVLNPSILTVTFKNERLLSTNSSKFKILLIAASA